METSDSKTSDYKIQNAKKKKANVQSQMIHQISKELSRIRLTKVSKTSLLVHSMISD